ncbi:MAG TPA: hypothetical protein PKN32_02130 [Bacteroidales bacterium]|nr:hypothetical protein [Bacteroidales bacterium]
MKKSGFILICIVLIASFLGCENQNDYDFTMTYKKFQLSENIQICCIEYINNNEGLICGGAKNSFGSIYKTTDGGTNWTMVFHSDSLSVNDIFYLNDSIVYACGDSLLYIKSVNGGNTWEIIKLLNYPYDEYYVPYNSVYAHNEYNIYLIGGEHYDKGLWSETETGNYPWTHDSYDNQFNSMCFVSQYVGFFGGYGILIVTEDGGNTFDNIDLYGNNFVDLETDSDQTVYALSDYGILYSTNDLGYNWTTEINDYKSEFTDMYFGETLAVVCGKNGKLYLKYNNQNDWEIAKDIPKVNYNCSFVKENGEIVLGSDNGELYIFNQKRTP